MSVAVHWAVRRFEMFLRTLSLSFPLRAGLFFWNRAWLIGASMVMFWFFVGAVGQALPHRKQQTVGELASGNRPTIDNGELSNETSVSLARAMYSTAMIVGSAAVVIAWHKSYRWYVVLLIAAGAYCISFVIPLLLLYRSKKQKHAPTREHLETDEETRTKTWPMKVLISLILAAISAYQFSWTFDIVIGGLVDFYDGQWPITFVVHALLSPIALIIALTVAPANDWVSIPFYFFGTMAVFGGIIGHRYDLGVGALMLGLAWFLGRGLRPKGQRAVSDFTGSGGDSPEVYSNPPGLSRGAEISSRPWGNRKRNHRWRLIRPLK